MRRPLVMTVPAAALALATFVAAMAFGGLRPWVAFACEAGPGYDPVADSDLVVVGQVARWEALAQGDAPSASTNSAFVPVRITLQVARALKGGAPATITFVDDASRLAIPAQNGAWAGASGGCGSFDADPTGKEVIIGLRREADGLYHANRLRTFYIGDGPTGGDYLAYRAALDRASNVVILHVSPPGAGPASHIRLTPAAGPAGTSVMVEGAGFTPADVLSVEILGNLETSRVATATVCVNGGFTVPVTIPQGVVPASITLIAVSLSTPMGMDPREEAPRATFVITAAPAVSKLPQMGTGPGDSPSDRARTGLPLAALALALAGTVSLWRSVRETRHHAK